jgi:hypothetical protein
MSSVGIVGGVCLVMLGCGKAFLGMRDQAGLIFASFSPFNVMALMISPYEFGGRAFEAGASSDLWFARGMVFVCAWIAAGAYAALVWAMYKSMVKNFDMTIRKQSR